MRHAEGDPKKERFFSIRRYESNGLVADQIGGMAFLVNELVVAMPGAIAVLVAVRVLIDLPVEIAVGTVEAIFAGELWAAAGNAICRITWPNFIAAFLE